MTTKKENKKIDLIFTIIVFILFLFISSTSPLMGDDWGNYINGSGGVSESIKYAIYSYQDYEGRFFSRIFINILTYYKYLWNIINPLVISIIYYLILKVSKHKDKYITPSLVLLSFLLVDVEAFRQIYVWLAGNITYLIPCITVFLLLYLNENNNKNKILYYLLPIISFITSMFVETVSVGIVIGHVIYIFYYYVKHKKINKILLLSLILSTIGFLAMTFSPGTMKRADTHSDFSNLSLINKVLINVPNLIEFTFIRNSFLVFLSVLTIIYLTNKYIKNKYISIPIYIYSCIVSTPTAILYYASTLNITFQKLLFFFNSHNPFVLTYWIIFSILIFCLIIKYIWDNKETKIFYLICVGLISNFAMLISPIWGGRTAYLTTICLSIALIYILKDHKLITSNNKLITNTLLFASCAFILFLIWGYSNVYIDTLYREELIKEDLNNNEDTIRIYVLSERFLWNPNPWGGEGYLADTLKAYYKIEQNKNIEMIFEK